MCPAASIGNAIFFVSSIRGGFFKENDLGFTKDNLWYRLRSCLLLFLVLAVCLHLGHLLIQFHSCAAMGRNHVFVRAFAAVIAIALAPRPRGLFLSGEGLHRSSACLIDNCEGERRNQSACLPDCESVCLIYLSLSMTASVFVSLSLS